MQDVQGMQSTGISLLSDRFRKLSHAYLRADPGADYTVPLVQLVRPIFVQYPSFQHSRREDAEECLGQLLKGIDGSYAARNESLPSSRVFGAPAEAGGVNIPRPFPWLCLFRFFCLAPVQPFVKGHLHRKLQLFLLSHIVPTCVRGLALDQR